MFRFIITALAFTVSTAASSQSFVEGVDYTRLKAQQPTQVAKDKIEIVELFRYGCIHCAHMDSVLNVWKKTMPAAAAFRSIHVTFGDPGQQNLARAHLAAAALGVADKIGPVMFKDVLVGAQPPTDLNVIAKLLEPVGVKAATFIATANSFSVTQKLKQNEAMAPRYELGGTPEFVVAGKYHVTVLTGKTQEYSLKIVDFLVAKELIERAAIKR
jgi:protein dithiol oxidoreductase (disulfide-forming)